jgi:hypothetical protein
MFQLNTSIRPVSQPATFLLLCLFLPVRLPTSIPRSLPSCTIAIIYRTITLAVSRWLLWSDGLRQKNILRFAWQVLGLTRLLCRWRLWKSWGWFNWYRRERYVINRIIHNDANQLTNSCSLGIYLNTLILSYYDSSKIPRINYSSTLIQITLIR